MKKLLWACICFSLLTHSIIHGRFARTIPKVYRLIVSKRTLSSDKISAPTTIQNSETNCTNNEALILYNLLKPQLQLLSEKITILQASIVTGDELSTVLSEEEEQ